MEVIAVQADITGLPVQVIVNAANSSLLGGGGVDGAIHREAGPRLLEACRALNGCRVGQAKLTPGFDLQARYVVHTVGPVWRGGTQGEAESLASCYRASLVLADQAKAESVAFPSISTGVYGYPIELAADVAISAVNALIRSLEHVRRIVFCCYSERDLALYRALLEGKVDHVR